MTMKKRSAMWMGLAASVALAGAAFAQETGTATTTAPAALAPVAKPAPKPVTAAAKPATTATAALPGQKPGQPVNPMKIGAPPPPAPLVPPKPVALVLRGLDKITGRPTVITAPINQPTKYATLTITARYCYSTPQSETPETSAFVQIDDARPDQPARRVFSGWMYASSPGLNGMQHPLYDVWVITCRTNAPGEVKAVASTAPVRAKSPTAGASTDDTVDLPADADQ
jgi:hypothetical protein